MNATDLGMQVWVGCLACYNAGSLNGRWIDAADAADWKCQNPTHEEFWVFDLENMPVREEMSPSTAQAWAELIDGAELNTTEEYEAFRAWLGNDHQTDPAKADPDSFRDAYCGTWNSEKDYAMDFAEDIGAVNEDAVWPNNYIDWDAATRDLFNDMWSAEVSGGQVAVFRYV